MLDDEVIRPLDQPVSASGALAVLRGNLAPEGAVMKASAASPRFFKHRGRALVFDDPAEDERRPAPTRTSTATRTPCSCCATPARSARRACPNGAACRSRRNCCERGVRDMVRISDARMSGTHYGTCILHVSPESAVGGPLALVQSGDKIEIDVEARRLHLQVGDDELARRRAAWRPPPQPYARGFARLYREHVTQAHEGCDFDFLQGAAADARAGHLLMDGQSLA